MLHSGVQMCIFAGCDFLKAPHGIGIKKAHQLMKKYRTFPRVSSFEVTKVQCIAESTVSLKGVILELKRSKPEVKDSASLIAGMYLQLSLYVLEAFSE